MGGEDINKFVDLFQVWRSILFYFYYEYTRTKKNFKTTKKKFSPSIEDCGPNAVCCAFSKLLIMVNRKVDGKNRTIDS